MRELKKKLTRRVLVPSQQPNNQLVISISPEGIAIKAFRQRGTGAMKLSWPALLEKIGYHKGPIKREAAFASTVPRGWLPVGGDSVWLNPQKYRQARGVILFLIQGVPENYFVVKVAGGKTLTIERPDLRPAPKAPSQSKRKQPVATPA